EDYLSDAAPVPVADGFLASTPRELVRVVTGARRPLPRTPHGRRALADRLVARLDALREAEERTLARLGEEAFDSLLACLHDSLLAAETTEDAPGPESRADDALR